MNVQIDFLSIRTYLLLIGFFFQWFNLLGQNQQLADSAISVYKRSIVTEDSSEQKLLYTIYSEHPNPDSIIKYAQLAYAKSDKIGLEVWKYKSLLNIGQAYKSKGDLEQSLSFYLKYLDYAKANNNVRKEALAYSAIGSVYRVQENYTIALSFYNAGIGKLRNLGDSTNLAVSLMNTGELYRVNHILDTAQLYFKESGLIFELTNYRIGKAYNLGNIGLVYAEQGKHQKAEENLVAATKILTELGDTYPIAVYNTYMADIYLDKGDIPRALDFAHASYNLALKDGLKEQIRDASQKLSELYETNQDYKKAFLYQEEYLAYRDSINNEETVREMADLRTEFEVSQKQIEVDLLNEEKKTSQLIRAGLLGLVLAMAGIAFVYVRRNKEKRLTNKLLREQKQQLQTQHNELAVLNTTKDRFFSIISHDLRGPVSSFKGLTTLMKMSLESKKYEDLHKMTEMLDKSSNQLSSLLDNLLAWALNQQGEFPYLPKQIQIKLLIKVVMARFKEMAELKKISIIEEVGAEVLVWADEESIKTIIRNLINNALKFTPQGGQIQILAMKEENYIHLKVADTGIGIPKEKFDQLFSANELKSTPGTDGEKGLGLGLRLVYEFTKMNKGVITAESEEGAGTTFTIKLPINPS